MERRMDRISSRTLEKIEGASLARPQRKDLEDLFAKPLSYVYDDRFRRPSQMNEILRREVTVVPGTAPTLENEQTLFLQMNYCRYKMGTVLRRLKRQAEWDRTDLKELLQWYQQQLEFRSKIVTANMGLVLAMSRRINSTDLEFTDLISEGSMALLRATEKFDCGRGWKFSTYACRAILKAFSRVAKQSYRYRNRFPAQLDTTMMKDDSLEQKREEDFYDLVDDVRDIMEYNLADLTDIEKSIVEMRFSLNDRDKKPLTLKQVGEVLGLTKERIRQIQKKALAKIRTITEERMVPVT